jgi:hypothetical protein
VGRGTVALGNGTDGGLGEGVGWLGPQAATIAMTARVTIARQAADPISQRYAGVTASDLPRAAPSVA